VDVSISQPAGKAATISGTSCAAPAKGQPLALGIIDDSGSMATSDPGVGTSTQRGTATARLVDALGSQDAVALTDYGVTSTSAAAGPLRDLVCSKAGTTSCAPTSASFTSDKSKLKEALGLLRPSGGTPLYEACQQMVRLVAGITGKELAIVLLSDGEPNNTNNKQPASRPPTMRRFPLSPSASTRRRREMWAPRWPV
jgi:hypothetical protein